MKKNMFDVVEIVEHNADFILLNVVGTRKDCILTGVLDGDEEMIKVMHDEYKTITVYLKNGRNYSWSSNTLVCDSMKHLRWAIMDCLMHDYKIPMLDMEGDTSSLAVTGRRSIPKKLDLKLCTWDLWSAGNSGCVDKTKSANVRLASGKGYFGNCSLGYLEERWGGKFEVLECKKAVTGADVVFLRWTAPKTKAKRVAKAS